MGILSTIPSPSSGTLDLGPCSVHLYGITLVIAMLLGSWITGRRFVARGGDWDLITRLAMWGIPSGIIGARLYHVATSWDQLPDAWWGPLAIWRGGLGVWGGVALGFLVGAVIAGRAGANRPLLADCLAPGLLVAQGVGRLGNWWNQELYGRPTDLPWALEIDHAAGYEAGTTFHPTFLYELGWDLAAALVLVLIVERRLRPRPLGVFGAYVAIYCFGRFWIEQLRVDAAHDILGMRLNGWVALIGFVAGTVVFLRRRGIRADG